MSDTRKINYPYEKYYELCAATTQTTCNLLNYEFYYYIPFVEGISSVHVPIGCLEPSTGKPRHPSWSKIPIVYDHLTRHECDWLLYLDSDAFLAPTCNLLEKFPHLINFGNDKPFRKLPFLCAGWFFIKNCTETLSFLNSWFNVSVEKYNMAHPWEQKAYENLNNFTVFVEPEQLYHASDLNINFSNISNNIHHLSKGTYKNDVTKRDQWLLQYIKKYYSLEAINTTEVKNKVLFDATFYSTNIKWK